jgi:hypothetical protein
MKPLLKGEKFSKLVTGRAAQDSRRAPRKSVVVNYDHGKSRRAQFRLRHSPAFLPERESPPCNNRIMSERLTAAQAQTMVNIIKKFLQEMIEPMDLELAAHAVLLEGVKQNFPDLVLKLDGLLNSARMRPDLRELMHQKYHVGVEEILRRFVEGIQDMESMEQILRDFLRDWKPGQVN